MSTRYSLETERLTLRQWRESDRDAFTRLCSEEELFWYPMKRALTDAEASERFDGLLAHWRTYGFGLFATEHDGTLIGSIGLAVPSWLPVVVPSVEIGWRIGREWWGKGLATEAARACLAYGFEDLLLDRIICIYQPENARSAAVAKRLGFTEYLWTEHERLGEHIKLAVSELRRSVWTP